MNSKFINEFRSEIAVEIKSRCSMGKYIDFLHELVGIKDDEAYMEIVREIIPLVQWKKQWVKSLQVDGLFEEFRNLKTSNTLFNRNKAPDRRIVIDRVKNKETRREYRERIDLNLVCRHCKAIDNFGHFFDRRKVQRFCNNCSAYAPPLRKQADRDYSIPRRTNEICVSHRIREEEVDEGDEVITFSKFSRWKSFSLYLHKWQGKTEHKGSCEDLERIRGEMKKRGLQTVDHAKLRALLHELGGMNHLYADIFTLLNIFGERRRVFSGPEISKIKNAFMKAGFEGNDQKGKHKNEYILEQVLSMTGL